MPSDAMGSAIGSVYRTVSTTWRWLTQHKAMAAITVVGGLLRFLWIISVPNVPQSDFADYYNTASILYHGYMPANINAHGAGYPMLLGMFFRLIHDNSILSGKVLNALLSTATLVLCWFVFRRLTSNPWVLYLSYVGVVFLLNYIAYTGVLGTEVFFTFLFAASLVLQLYAVPRVIRYPLLGVIIGLGALTKSYFLADVLIVGLTWWLTSKDWRATMQGTAIVAMFSFATIAPATIGNFEQFHMFILNDYNGGYVLFINNNDQNQNGGWVSFEDIKISPAFRQELLAHGVHYPDIVPFDASTAVVEPLFRDQALTWIRAHPLEFLGLGVIRVTDTYYSGNWDIASYALDQTPANVIQNNRGLAVLFDVNSVWIDVVNAAAALTALVGLIHIARDTVSKNRLSIPLVVLTLNVAFPYVVIFLTTGQPRYAYPTLFLATFCFVQLGDSMFRYFNVTRTT